MDFKNAAETKRLDQMELERLESPCSSTLLKKDVLNAEEWEMVECELCQIPNFKSTTIEAHCTSKMHRKHSCKMDNCMFTKFDPKYDILSCAKCGVNYHKLHLFLTVDMTFKCGNCFGKPKLQIWKDHIQKGKPYYDLVSSPMYDKTMEQYRTLFPMSTIWDKYPQSMNEVVIIDECPLCHFEPDPDDRKIQKLKNYSVFLSKCSECDISAHPKCNGVILPFSGEHPCKYCKHY